MEIMRKSWGSKVDPLLKDPMVPYNSRALIDACRPYEKVDTFPRGWEGTSDHAPAWIELADSEAGMKIRASNDLEV